MSNYNKVVVTTPTYSVTDMAEGSTPICDTKILSGSSWNFNSEELPATVYYESTSVSMPKTYVFASDSHHVEMSTNRTLEEEYTSLLGKFGKEIDSPDGSAIQVNDGISGKVLKMSIKGKTVKSQAYNWKNTIIDYTTKQLGIWHSINNNVPCVIILKVAEIKNNPNLEVQVTYNTNLTAYPKTVLTNDGYYKIDLSTYGTNIRIDYIRIASPLENQSFKLVDYTIINKSDADYVLQTFNGLNSTQAILNNNGQSYPIYEPTIQGKTRILNAQGVEVEAGTAGAKLVSLEPNDSKLPKLGSVPFISDFIDGAGKILTIHTKEEILNHAGNWKVFNTYNNVVAFELAIDGAATDTASTLKGVCDRFIYEPTFNDKEHFYFYTNRVRVFIDKSKASTIEQFKTWLQANPTTIRYQLATPIITKLTAEQMKAYNAYKKVILLGGVGDVKDTLEILEDGSAIVVNNTVRRILDKSFGFGYLGQLTYKSHFGTTTANQKPNSPVISVGAINKTTGYDVDDDNVYCYIANGFNIFVPKTITTLQQLNEYLDTKQIAVIYIANTPTTTHIPKELVPTILIHKNNILETGRAVKPSSFKVTVPVDKLAEIEARLQALESTTVDVVLNK